jgi:hypothetical protein
MRRWLLNWRLVGLGAALIANFAFAQLFMRDLDDPDAPKWAEEEVSFPEFPKDENLLQFYVSEVTTNQFFIDASTLQVGKDGVVRYVIVVRTRGGAVNISFEGLRCESREYKTYASGHRDGTWAKARQSAWRPIGNKSMNRQHAALSRDLFCPSGVAIQSPAEGRDALRLGKHPQAL